MSGFSPMPYTVDCDSNGFRLAGSLVFMRIGH
jgi:hypothetical protein